MTMNVMENIRKMMGWCPNSNAAKRMVTLPVDEQFLSGRDGKKETSPTKTGWANIYRNYILLQTMRGVVGFGLVILAFKYLFQMVFNQSIIIKGTIIGIVISTFIIVQEWKQLNRVNQSQAGVVKNIFFQTLQLAIFFAAIMFLTFTIGKDEPLQFMLSIFFPLQWIHYPPVIYWERKNRKTIYRVEEKFLRWKPVSIPDQSKEVDI